MAAFLPTVAAAAAFLTAAAGAPATPTATDDDKGGGEEPTFLPPCISASAAARAAASLCLAASFLAFSLLHLASQSARSSKSESSQLVLLLGAVRSVFKLVLLKPSDDDDDSFAASMPPNPPPIPQPTMGTTGPCIAEMAFEAEFRSGLGGGDTQGDEPDDEDEGELVPWEVFEFARRHRRLRRRWRRLRGESWVSRIACEILSLASSSSPLSCVSKLTVIICRFGLEIRDKGGFFVSARRREKTRIERGRGSKKTGRPKQTLWLAPAAPYPAPSRFK